MNEEMHVKDLVKVVAYTSPSFLSRSWFYQVEIQPSAGEVELAGQNPEYRDLQRCHQTSFDKRDSIFPKAH